MAGLFGGLPWLRGLGFVASLLWFVGLYVVTALWGVIVMDFGCLWVCWLLFIVSLLVDCWCWFIWFGLRLNDCVAGG